MYDRSGNLAGAFGGPGTLPPEAVQCACDVDLRYARLIKAIDVRGWDRVSIQAVLESGSWTGVSVTNDARIALYRSVNGRDAEGDAIGELSALARLKTRMDPAGAAFIIALIEPGSTQSAEATVSLYASGNAGGGSAGGLVALVASGTPVAFP